MLKGMKLDDFLKQRQEKVQWRYINGFDNGDIETNGELETINTLSNYYNVFVDVGANNGEFCKKNVDISSEIQIEAFEANPELIQNLKTILQDRGQVNSIAISNETGTATLKIHSNDSGVSSLFDRTMMMPSFTSLMLEHEVELKKLDHYYNQIIHGEARNQTTLKGLFIKIDIEGNELNAIKSAEKLLSYEDAPIFLMFEYSYGWIESCQKLKEAFHFLDSVEFDFFRVTPLGFEKIKFFDHEMEDFRYCNYLAVKNFPIDSFCTSKEIMSHQGESKFYPFSDWE